ncbi:efflux RND transporter permease subunit [Minwuia thermotolerans]|uniref:Multidrug transporter AcrB n=1 Tax=Minwuia thermotolerans TaxID=2056226 RepID=A0A2M9FYJ4_9PROT|nr:efflux RND transporter permease subunit [Minwuia thermotolerans]PJK28522.1 multidrug transporter AcrB [Minwuia thermotolerans]
MSGQGGLAGLSVRRPLLAIVLNLLIIIAGIAALLGVEVRELPNIDRPVVGVRADFPGGSPETIDAEVTSVVESAVARVNGVVNVRSSSEEDNFRIRIEFRSDVDLVDAANDVREAVSRVVNRLPAGVEDLFVVKADADAYPIIDLAISSDSLPVEALTEVIENEITPAFTSIEGVADLSLFGEREKVLRVAVDPLLLASHGLSIADVSRVLQSAQLDVPAGSFSSGDQDVIVRADASVSDVAGLEALVLRGPVRLGDVAEVFFSPADPLSVVRLDGREVINVGVIRQARANTVAISRDVKRVVAALNARFPDLTIETISDDAVFIEGAIEEVLISLGFAVLIVVAVVALFIRSLGATLIPMTTIPVALIGAVAGIWLMGFSINLITLLALVIATGLVVDDSVVVLENIQRRRREGMKARAAAVLGARQVFFAVIATTAVLVSVFVPISFLPSTAGRLFSEFGFVLAVTVILSSFVALSLCPMIASRLPGLGRAPARRGPLALAGGGLAALYDKALTASLAAPLVTVTVFGLIAGSAALVFGQLGEELAPAEDRGEAKVRLQGPDGTGLDYTDRQVEQVEALFRPWVERGVVRNVFSVTGSYDLNRGQIDAALIPWEAREVGQAEIEADISPALKDIAGANVGIRRGNSLGLRGSESGINFALTGASYPRIALVADEFALAVRREIPQLDNVRIEYQSTQPQLSVLINRSRAADLGVAMEDLAATVRALVDGDEVAELTVDDRAIPVILESKTGVVTDPSDLLNLYVPAADGRLTPLSQLVTFREEGVAAELDRHGQRRAIEIRSDLPPTLSQREAVDSIRELAAERLPGDIGLLFLGEAATLEETTSDVQITYVIALVVIFLVLVAQFESLTSALIVMATVPFGVGAAVYALWLTGTTINIYSQIGVLLLVGVMAKNGILMVEFADQLRDRGASVREAAREAALIRFRAIGMTMVSTVLAGLPLILGAGPGSEARGAIGWVVFGGLGLAAVFTLLLTPAVYVLLAWMAKPRGDAAKALQAELAESERPRMAPDAAD